MIADKCYTNLLKNYMIHTSDKQIGLIWLNILPVIIYDFTIRKPVLLN